MCVCVCEGGGGGGVATSQTVEDKTTHVDPFSLCPSTTRPFNISNTFVSKENIKLRRMNLPVILLKLTIKCKCYNI